MEGILRKLTDTAMMKQEAAVLNWINGFEGMCYAITGTLLVDIIVRKRWPELRLFCSAALAGFALEQMAVRVQLF